MREGGKEGEREHVFLHDSIKTARFNTSAYNAVPPQKYQM